jgi:4-amino-4-deoxy-L-arabinose transferase-like glycosyltransferase
MVLVIAAGVTYAPFASLPPLQDDYLQVALAEQYGGRSGWGALLADPLYRCRATSLLLTALTLKLFGLSILAFNLTSILLHVLNSLLVYCLGACRWIGWPLSFAAALVFAVRERHHEAVIWYASLHEPLVMLFVLLAVLGWIQWIEGRSTGWLLAAGAAWALALFSKESGVVLAVLLPALTWCYPGRKRAALWTLLVGVLVTALYFGWGYAQRDSHQHFKDGTFNIAAATPVRTLLNSAARGLWIWGGLSVAVLLRFRRSVNLRACGLGVFWFLAGLLPYCFLSYMPRIPSRHHYIAGAGAAMLIGLAAVTLLQHRRTVVVALAAVLVAHQWTYLWTYKRAQFIDRAELTEGLVRLVRANPGATVAIGCRELNIAEARRAVKYRLGLGGEHVLPLGSEGQIVYQCGNAAQAVATRSTYDPSAVLTRITSP